MRRKNLSLAVGFRVEVFNNNKEVHHRILTEDESSSSRKDVTGNLAHNTQQLYQNKHIFKI